MKLRCAYDVSPNTGEQLAHSLCRTFVWLEEVAIEGLRIIYGFRRVRHGALVYVVVERFVEVVVVMVSACSRTCIGLVL